VARLAPEIAPKGEHSFPQWQARDDVREKVDSLRIKSAGQAVTGPLPQNNSVLLAPAASELTSYPAILTKPYTTITGVPGATLKSLTLSANSTATLTGVRVLGAVSLAAGAVLLATGCRFDEQVQMASGAKATFTNCFLNGVNNAGVPANAYILGGQRVSGSNTNVTVIAEIL